MATCGDKVAHDWPEWFWPMQRRGCQGVLDAMTDGDRRLILASPTGTGKSAMMSAMIEWATRNGFPSILYTNRRMLFDQTARVLEKDGFDIGLRAAGHPTATLRDIQLAMTQSEYSAVVKKETRLHHPARLVLADELHCQGGSMLAELMDRHHKDGATIVGITATPIDLDGEWDRLVVAGTNSDGRKCGALVPAVTHCPDQPDLKHIKKYRVGDDLTDKQNRSAMMRPGVFGRVWEHWNCLNPERKPTILFGPDVAGSIFFAQQFKSHGVPAAHIDAKQIWVDGEFIESSDENRQELLRKSESGEIVVLCNRFVLREGINLPHLAVAIFATVFGSLRTYIQAGGRVLRAFPGLNEVTIIDHGGNYIRHGSLNSDRVWELGMRGYRITGMRQDMMREHPETEPIICPRCGMGRLSGPTCPKCGYSHHERSRVVVQIDGTLKRQSGPSHRPHRIALRNDTQAIWERCYYRAKSKKWNATFNQALALFMRENHYYPPSDLPLMPNDAADWYERVADVPRERLN